MNLSSDVVIKATDLQISNNKVILIKNLSFQVLIGEIFGVAGSQIAAPRGLILALAGFISPEKGTVKFAGVATPESGRKTGKIAWYLPDISFPSKMTAEEVLLFSGSMRGLSSRETREKADELISLFDLKGVLGERWESLDPLGRQRVSVVASLMGDPDYIIMDCFSIIDRDLEFLLRNYLVASAGIGKTIVVGTERPEGFCDSVLLLKGQSSFEIGAPEDLKMMSLGYGRIQIVVRGVSLSKVEDALMKADCSWNYIGEDRLAISAPASPSETNYVLSELINNGGTIEEVKRESPQFKDLLKMRKEE